MEDCLEKNSNRYRISLPSFSRSLFHLFLVWPHNYIYDTWTKTDQSSTDWQLGFLLTSNKSCGPSLSRNHNSAPRSISGFTGSFLHGSYYSARRRNHNITDSFWKARKTKQKTKCRFIYSKRVNALLTKRFHSNNTLESRILWVDLIRAQMLGTWDRWKADTQTSHVDHVITLRWNTRYTVYMFITRGFGWVTFVSWRAVFSGTGLRKN